MAKKYKDGFCTPLTMPDGKVIAGGAARNHRIGQYENGLDDIIEDVSKNAAADALERADALREATNIIGRVKAKTATRSKKKPVLSNGEDDDDIL